MTEDIPIGAPWKHYLKITDLQANKMDAGISLIGARWIWPTVAISGLSAALLGYGSCSAFAKGEVGGGVVAAVFACLAFVVTIFATGCASYAVRLKIEDNTVTFGRQFFWICKGVNTEKESLGYLKCWSHSTGSGSAPSYHVCLHPLSSIPVLCLFSQEYFPDIVLGAGKMMGRTTDRLSRDEALNLAVNKAKEIAACLDIENKTGSNH